MRIQGRWIFTAAAAALCLFGGAEGSMAASAPAIYSATLGKDTATDRPVLTLVGKSLTKFTGFTLADSAEQPVPGTIDTLLRSKGTLVLMLPAGMPGGEYDLASFIKTVEGPILHLEIDSGVLFGGTFGAGAIPAEGEGARMMWYPGKAAFRAGKVNGTQWDDASVGFYSIAMGGTTTASGFGSIAMGIFATASSDYSTAMGASTTASGNYSTAMGYGTNAGGIYSTAMGADTNASGYISTAMGASTTASGDYSTAMGNITYAVGNNSTAMGTDTHASGRSSTAMGQFTYATGDYSTTMGLGTTASATYSTAMGSSTTASGGFSTAMGNTTTASGLFSTAMGNTTTAIGFASTAVGDYTTALAYASLALGRFNVVVGNSGAVIATDPVLVVGNGTSQMATSDAFTLLRNGNLTIAGTLTQASDLRMKKDVAPLTGVLSRIAGIRGVSYEFKDTNRSPEGRQIGLVAQEVKQAFPELVREDSQGTLSVSYQNFTAVLLEAVKEQQAELEARDREVAALKRELAEERAATEKRLSRLEALLEAGGFPAKGR